MAWIYLFAAIIAEVIGTVALKFSAGFTKPIPTLTVFVGYAIAFFLLAKVVQVLPLAMTYAIWSGLGIALAAIAGWALLGQRLDAPALIGIGLIVAGVLVLNVYSGATAP